MKPLPKKKDGISYIYALIDPRINKVRYVGEAVNPSGRLAVHLTGSQVNDKETYRARWVRKLISLSLKPRMVVLETCSLDIWQDREKWWISYYRKLNGSLMTNSTDGGEGWHGMHHSEKSKARFSEWQTGRRLTPEHRKNLSSARKGHLVSAETREKQRIGNLGKIMTPEQRGRMSSSKKESMSRLSKEERRKITEKARASISPKRSGLSSVYRGVCKPKKQSWLANIRIPGGNIKYLGAYPTEIGAASAYNGAARELYGEKAILNIIPGGEVLELRAPKGNRQPRVRKP